MALFGSELAEALEAAGAHNLAIMATWAAAAGRAEVAHGVEEGASDTSWLRRRGTASARGASRDSLPGGDPGNKAPRDEDQVENEHQILVGAWSEGFIDGGEADYQRLARSGALERARAILLDELRDIALERARAILPEVEWGELRAALVDEGLSVEELRRELADEGAPLVLRLTAEVRRRAGAVGARQPEPAPDPPIALATLLAQVKAADVSQPEIPRKSDLVTGQVQFKQQFENVMRARMKANGKKMLATADVEDMKCFLLLDNGARKLFLAIVNEADLALLHDFEVAAQDGMDDTNGEAEELCEAARVRTRRVNNKYRK
jgi:hypothetical protein